MKVEILKTLFLTFMPQMKILTHVWNFKCTYNTHQFFLQFLRDGTETVTLSRIEFRPKVNDHERDVVCRAENTNIANSAIEATHKLVIHCEY